MKIKSGSTSAKEVKLEGSWILLNETDGIQADPKVYSDMLSAEAGMALLRNRFVARGTYLTSSGTVIPATEVKIRIVPYER